jgi:hypothetical protein
LGHRRQKDLSRIGSSAGLQLAVGAGGGCSWAVDSKAASRCYWFVPDSTPVIVQEDSSLLQTSNLALEAPTPL